MTEETAVVAHEVIAAIEVEEVRVVARAFVRRRTPIETAALSAVERRPVAISSTRKEDAVTVWSFYIIAVNAILCCPGPSAVV